jgi:TatD DNase family protein
VIDTHAHLDACSEPAAELMARARAVGVGRCVTIGSGLESCRAALAIAASEGGVVATLGIHPHQAGDAQAADLDGLRELLAAPEAVAVGEAGLDYYRDYAPRHRQRDLFEAQAALASELGKPLIVHTRAAEADTLAVLETLPAAQTVVLHCFSSPELLPAALERGWYVSFAGNVTYPKAEDLRLAAAQVPADRLLAETDSPYLAPQPVRGRPNEPAHVRYVIEALAAIRDMPVAELDRAIETNADAVFGQP